MQSVPAEPRKQLLSVTAVVRGSKYCTPRTCNGQTMDSTYCTVTQPISLTFFLFANSHPARLLFSTPLLVISTLLFSFKLTDRRHVLSCLPDSTRTFGGDGAGGPCGAIISKSRLVRLEYFTAHRPALMECTKCGCKYTYLLELPCTLAISCPTR
jgi:hypothetical protein